MIGLRTGLATGLRTGLATGIGADEIGNGAAAVPWTVDGTSGIAVPSTAAEWTKFIAANGLSIGVPDALWRLQETSGDFADSIGSITLTATGTISYNQSVSGWSRRGFLTSDGVIGGARSTSASLPDMSTTSLSTLVLANVTVIGSTRDIYESGPSSGSKIAVIATNRVRAFSGGNNASGAFDPRNAVRPYFNKYDHANSVDTVYTDQEKLTPTFGAFVSATALTVGGSGTAPPTATYVYAVSWFATKAEVSDANVKALLIAMGFAIPWS